MPKFLAAGLAAFLMAGLVAYGFDRPSIEDMQRATVVVQIGDAGHGSGVIIRGPGGGSFVLTAGHVARSAKDAGEFVVITRDGREHVGQIVWISESDDLALISTGDRLAGAVELACTNAAVGERVTVVGAPTPAADPLRWYVSTGNVGGYYTLDHYPFKHNQVMLFTAPIYSGTSGGPVFNDAGDVVGIAVAMATAPSADWRPVPMAGFYLATSAEAVCAHFGG